MESNPSRRSPLRPKPPSVRSEHYAPTLSEHGTAGRVDATIPEDRTWPRGPHSNIPSAPPSAHPPPATTSLPSESSSPISHTSHWRPSYAATHSDLSRLTALPTTKTAPVPAPAPVLYDPYYSSQIEQRRPSKARYWDVHFCGKHQIDGKCCVKPSFQGPLASRNIDHLPVCHLKC